MKENNFIEIFKCPILNIKLDIENKNIYNFIKNLKKNSFGKIMSNRGGWQSENLNLEKNELKPLIKDIQKYSDIFIEFCSLKKTRYNIINMWANINKYKDYNLPHIHHNSIISGSFYLKTPKNCGRIVFYHPSENRYYDWNLNTLDKITNKNCNEYSLDVEKNMLLLFPSWLKHYVEPNLNKKEERISIAFNIVIDKLTTNEKRKNLN